jgi:hypothetical protein
MLPRRLDGRLWQRTIARRELEATKARYPVISTRLAAGRTLVHVVADTSPGDGFAAVEPTLEDVYFAAIAGRLEVPERAVATA